MDNSPLTNLKGVKSVILDLGCALISFLAEGLKGSKN